MGDFYLNWESELDQKSQSIIQSKEKLSEGLYRICTGFYLPNRVPLELKLTYDPSNQIHTLSDEGRCFDLLVSIRKIEKKILAEKILEVIGEFNPKCYMRGFEIRYDCPLDQSPTDSVVEIALVCNQVAALIYSEPLPLDM